MGAPAAANQQPRTSGDWRRLPATLTMIAVGAMGAAACGNETAPPTSGGPVAEQPVGEQPAAPIHPTEAAPLLSQVENDEERADAIAGMFGVDSFDDLTAQEDADEYGNFSLLVYDGPTMGDCSKILVIGVSERFDTPIDDLYLIEKTIAGGSRSAIVLSHNGAPVGDKSRTAVVFKPGSGETIVFTPDLMIKIGAGAPLKAPYGYVPSPSPWRGDPAQAPTVQLSRFFG